jgi:hypothetical protein
VAAIAFAAAANVKVRWWRSLIACAIYSAAAGSMAARRARGSWAAGPAAGTGTYPLLAAARGRDKWRVTVRSLSSMRETLTRRPLYGDLCLARDDVDGIALGLELMAG